MWKDSIQLDLQLLVLFQDVHPYMGHIPQLIQMEALLPSGQKIRLKLWDQKEMS